VTGQYIVGDASPAVVPSVSSGRRERKRERERVRERGKKERDRRRDRREIEWESQLVGEGVERRVYVIYYTSVTRREE